MSSVPCHVSHDTCHVSYGMSQLHNIFLDTLVKLFGGESFIDGAYSVLFVYNLEIFFEESLHRSIVYRICP